MAKKENTAAIKKYTYGRVLVAGLICGLAALGINYMILQGVLKHDYDWAFAPVLVGFLLAILNFKPLSKLSIVLLPPAFLLLAIAPIVGIAIAGYFGQEASSFSTKVQLFIQIFPFLVVTSIVYNWYASLAGKKSFLTYALVGITAVLAGFVLFREGFSYELVMAAYLGVLAMLFSKLHVGTILS